MSRSPLTWMMENLEVDGKDLVIVFDRAIPPSKTLLRKMGNHKAPSSSSSTDRDENNCPAEDKEVVIGHHGHHYSCCERAESIELSPLMSPIPTKQISTIITAIGHHHSPNSVVMRTSSLEDWEQEGTEVPRLQNVE